MDSSPPPVGVWRSWLARALREREVAGSSPATPTINHPIHTHPLYWAKKYPPKNWGINCIVPCGPWWYCYFFFFAS